MHYCEVPGCSNHNGMPDITVYMFPSESVNPERHLIWKKKVGITKPITNDVRICNMHFKHDDFYQRKKNTSIKEIIVPLLKPTAIPSRNLPGQCYEDDASDCEEEPSEEELVKRRRVEQENEIHFEITKSEPKSIDPISNLLDVADSASAVDTKKFMEKHFSKYWDAKEQAKYVYAEIENNQKKPREYEIIIPPRPTTVLQPEIVRPTKLPSSHIQEQHPINVTATEDEVLERETVPISSKSLDPSPENILEISNKLSDMKELINTRMDKLESEIATLRTVNLLAQQFPFDNPTDLLDFEAKLKTTSDLLQSFHHYLNSIPGTETGELFLTKILSKLFTTELRKSVVWDTNQAKISGRHNRSTTRIVINNFKMINIIRSTVLQQFNANVNYNAVEDEFKRFFVINKT